MTQIKNILIILLVANTCLSCNAQKNLENVEFLIGTWKMENKNTYESWQKVSDTEYKGKSYKLHEGQMQVSEFLTIKISDDKIIYEATVPNQNDGKTIPFELNMSTKDWISFENPNHDFPKKIQYKIIDDTKVQVNVSGEDDKGFSYYQLKQ